MIGSDLLI